MGVLGLLYWEYESKPTGSGYYFSSIGVEDGEYKTNSSLCVSHDDGGTVTAYGYGYYWSAGSTTEPALSTGITMTALAIPRRPMTCTGRCRNSISSPTRPPITVCT